MKDSARAVLLSTIVALAAVALSISTLFVRTSFWPTLLGIIIGLTALIAALTASASFRLSRIPQSAGQAGQDVETLKEEYLRKWIALEGLIRTKLTESGKDDTYIAAPLSTILRMYTPILDDTRDQQSALMRNLRLRNKIVHASSEDVSADELSRAISELNSFFDKVNTQPAPQPAKVISNADTVPGRDEEEAIHRGFLRAAQTPQLPQLAGQAENREHYEQRASLRAAQTLEPAEPLPALWRRPTSPANRTLKLALPARRVQ